MAAELATDDVAAILEALRQAVRAQRAAQGAGELGTALSAIERELHHAAEQLEITRVVSAHWPLEGRGLYERGWVLVHKVVRRALRWYIPPIVAQQNAFNAAAARAIHLLIESHAELRDQLAELRMQAEQLTSPNTSSAVEAPHVPTAPVAPPTSAALQALAERKAVSAHQPLGGDTPLTQARALAQRGMRQYLRWMLNPIVEQQNACNGALSGAVPPLLAADSELRARLAALRAMHHGALSGAAGAARGLAGAPGADSSLRSE